MTPMLLSSDLPGVDPRWIRRYAPVAQPKARLVCLPHAGGTANFYRNLALALTPYIELLAIQYPGRQDRINEAPLTTIQAYATEVAAALEAVRDDVPLAVFGHSMGALIAYELLATQNRFRAARCLFVSAHLPPHVQTATRYDLSSEGALIDHLIRLGGPGSELLEDPTYAELLLPSIRADLQAINHYQHQAYPPLPCDVVAFMGREDPATPREAIAKWRHLASGRFDLHTLPGGHFYLTGAVHEVASQIRRHLSVPA